MRALNSFESRYLEEQGLDEFPVIQDLGQGESLRAFDSGMYLFEEGGVFFMMGSNEVADLLITRGRSGYFEEYFRSSDPFD